MLQFTKKALFFLVALNLLTPAAARAATIYQGEPGAMWNRADATSFNNSIMNSAGADHQHIRARFADTNWHLSSHLSGKPTDDFFAQKTVIEEDVARHRKSYSAELTEPLISPVTPATTNGSEPEYTGDDASVTHSSLLGPISGPSLKWLFIGALVALVGISRGTRGIHESV